MSTAWSKKRTGHLLRILFACWLVILTVATARADADASRTRQALAALGQLQRSVQDLRGAMNTPLGPYNLQTRCTWCSDYAWWGLGMCTRNTTLTQRATIDFSGTRQRLAQLLAVAQDQTASFSSAYAPAQTWLRGIPGLNGSFQQTADVVLKASADIKAGQDPDDAQRQQVTRQLQSLVTGLANSRRQLDAGSRALALYLQQQASNRRQIVAAIGGADRSARQALDNFVQQTRTWRCQDGLDARFNQIRSDFNNAIQRVAASFQGMEASSRAAEQGLATLSATLASAQADYQGVLNQLQAAQNDQLAGFIERLHLDVARLQWQQLADYAMQVQRGGIE